MAEKGKFIVLEGVDGCGKSTHAFALSEWLDKEKNKDVFHTKEPSDGQIGVLLRNYLKQEAPPLVDALLFVADRAEHLENEVKPAVDDGQIVICERYMGSTIAYQAAQGLDWEWLKDLNSFALKPDLTILLDLRPDVAVKRTSSGEKFETFDFLKKVSANYTKLAEEDNYVVIDASKGKSVVQEKIQQTVSKVI